MKNITALSDNQLRVLQYANNWRWRQQDTTQPSPTYQEIATALGVSRQRAFQLCEKLRAYGLLHPRGNQHAHRDVRVTGEVTEYFRTLTDLREGHPDVGRCDLTKCMDLHPRHRTEKY